MDVVSSILNTLEKQSASIVKNKELSSEHQQEQHSLKCNICGEFFLRANFLTHNLVHIQESSRKKESVRVSKDDDSHLNKKTSYKCPLCGKIYTERKTFANHKNNHKRNKKLKKKGVHPFDKNGSIKSRNPTTGQNSATMGSTDYSESMSINGNIDYSEVRTKEPVKLMINPDVTANPMKTSTIVTAMGNVASSELMSVNCNVSYSDVKTVKAIMSHVDVTANPMSCAIDWAPPEPVNSCLILENSDQAKRNPPAKKTFFKCNICNKTFTKKKTFVNHISNHKQNKKKGKLLFYDRPTKKQKPSTKLTKKK